MSSEGINKKVKIAQAIIFFLGIITIAVGIYSTGPRLVQFVLHNISSHEKLSEQTTASLYGLQTKIIIAGILLVVLSIFLKYLITLWNSFVKKIQSANLFERLVKSIGNLFSFLYRIGTREKFLLGLATVILLGFLIPSVFLNPNGGVHVEGIDLQLAKNLVAHGKYATLTTKGFDTYTYMISAGPGILLPDALVFKLFGINVYYARVLYSLFVILTVFMFYYLAQEVFNKKVALLTLFLLIPLMPLTGNQSADAYIPALFYFLVGAHFWFKSIDSKNNTYLVLSGLLWGLSFQTQWLFLFAIFAVVITCIILYFANNSLKSKYYLVPSLMVILITIAWTIFRILNVGMGPEVQQIQQFWAHHGRRAVGITAKTGIVSSIFSIIRPIESLVQVDIWRNLEFFLAVPSIIYIVMLINRNKWLDYKKMFLLVFTIIWFSWWLVFNFDLPETHLFIVQLMLQFFIAKLLYDIWNYSIQYKKSFVELAENNGTKKEATIFYLVRVVIVCTLVALIMFPLFEAAGDMYANNINLVEPYNRMLTYIDKNIPKDAVFSGWGESMPWYLDLNNGFDRVNKNRAIYPFDQREKVPEYFVVSPEWPLVKVTDQWPSVFHETKKQEDLRKQFLEQNCTLIKTFSGPKFRWLLFKVNNPKLTQSSTQ